MIEVYLPRKHLCTAAQAILPGAGKKRYHRLANQAAVLASKQGSSKRVIS
jgi:hypothetical protein